MPSITAYQNGYRAQLYVKGVRDSQTFRTKREAQQWAAQREQELRASSALGGKTFAQAAERYMTEVCDKKDGGPWEKLRLARMVEHFGQQRLSEIQAPDIARWRDARLAGDGVHKAVSGSTVVRESNLLRNVFTIARDEWRWMDHRPFAGVKLPEEAEPRHQRWGWRAIRRVLRRLGHVTGKAPQTKNQQVALAFLISLSTSLRAAEVLRVGPDTYNAATRVIVVKAKGKLRSEIPAPRRAAKHCALANFTITSQSLDVLFRKARDATLAGDLTFHDARATALTLLARRVDILTLARISQHSDLRMLQRYYRESSAEIAGRI